MSPSTKRCSGTSGIGTAQAPAPSANAAASAAGAANGLPERRVIGAPRGSSARDDRLLGLELRLVAVRPGEAAGLEVGQLEGDEVVGALVPAALLHAILDHALQHVVAAEHV